jgi:predicted ATPase
MINHIKLKNFKAFPEAEIPLTALNLFTGINGIGKSSFIQSLLLLRQSHLERQLPERFILNHEQYVQLGKSQDIFNMYAAEKDHLSIQLQTDLIPNLYIEVKPEQNKTFLDIAHYSPSKWTSVEKEPLFNHRFQYLYAERESPKKSFAVDQYAVEQLRSLGNKGQHTAHFIAKYQTETVKLPSLIDAQAVSDKLGAQIDAWLVTF